MSEKHIEIVTPVHNRQDETRLFLESLAAVDRTGIRLHVIVVDDGSTDGTAAMLSDEFPDVEVVSGDGNLWYTAGMNRGLSAALKHKPDYILGVNNDCVFDEECLTAMVACAERHPRSVVGSLIVDRDRPDRIFQVSPRWELAKGGYRHWIKQTLDSIPKRPWKVELIVGNCVLFPALAIEEVGLMDERRLVQFGDAEYTPRMRRAGWQLLIEPRAKVFCKPNDVVSGFRSLPLKDKIRKIFNDRTGPYSLHRRFYSSLGGAPDKVQGLLAVPIFYARVLLGISQEGPWAVSQPEPPLAETFSTAVVDE